jgi:hypothetical protein
MRRITRTKPLAGFLRAIGVETMPVRMAVVLRSNKVVSRDVLTERWMKMFQ